MSGNTRACPHCGGDITDQLDVSYEHGYQQGYEKRARADIARDNYERTWDPDHYAERRGDAP